MVRGGGKGKPKASRIRPMGALNWVEVLHEMNVGDNRTAAVVAASFVENNLGFAITTRLKELSPAQHAKLFDDDRAVLGTFSAKIEIAFALNLFDQTVKDDLDAIRHVRNQFAHNLDVRDFDHSEVRDHCDALFGTKYLAWTESLNPPKPEPDRRQKYLNAAAHLTSRFDLEAKHLQRPPAAAVPTYETAPPSLR